jgi:hypothetical protein
MNNPIATFKAENKLLQLKYARRVGFNCPDSIAVNTCPNNLQDEDEYIVKSIDSTILRIDEREAFVYANRLKGHEIKAAIFPWLQYSSRITYIQNRFSSDRYR